MTSVLNLVVYHSPLFAAHWALFIPSPTNAKIGRRIHADGSPASGFEVLFETDYDLRDCIQSYEVIQLGVVDVENLECVARSIEAPKKSLVSASSMGPRTRIDLKNCQTWLTEVIKKMVADELINVGAIERTEKAPKN